MWDIDFFWTRATLCLAGVVLTAVLFMLTCSRSSRRKDTSKVSWHRTHRGPAQ